MAHGFGGWKVQTTRHWHPRKGPLATSQHDEEGERQVVSSLFLKQSLLVTLARPWENYPISSEGDDFTVS